MRVPGRVALLALFSSSFSQAFVLISPNAIPLVIGTGTQQPSKRPTITFDSQVLVALSTTNHENSAIAIDNNDVTLDEISDAEAVLSCQSYLKRHKRLEWVAGEERKRQRRSASPSIRDGNAAVGFFWEDPTKLKYLVESYPKRNIKTGQYLLVEQDEFENGEDHQYESINEGAEELEEALEDDDEEEEEEEEIWETVIHSRSAVQRFTPPKQDETEEMEDFATIDDGAPTPSHVRRSRAAKRRWADPEWRTAWYARRWGGKVQSNKEHRKLEERMRGVNVDKVLAECATLTQEEIAHAIKTYVVANRKRSQSRRSIENTINATDVSLRVVSEDTPLPIQQQEKQQNATAHSMDQQEMLKLRRQERARRATLAYQQRLENQKHRKKAVRPTMLMQQQQKQHHHHHRVAPVLNIRSFPPPIDASPISALKRIEWELNHNRVPCVNDVQLLLLPKKMPRRKDVLRRILNDVFDLRGKCVPVNHDLNCSWNNSKNDVSAAGFSAAEIKNGTFSMENDIGYLFVTQCTIDELCAFVIYKLQQQQIQE